MYVTVSCSVIAYVSYLFYCLNLNKNSIIVLYILQKKFVNKNAVFVSNQKLSELNSELKQFRIEKEILCYN